MINSDEEHFVKAKKKAQLRIKDQLGPFVIDIFGSCDSKLQISIIQGILCP